MWRGVRVLAADGVGKVAADVSRCLAELGCEVLAHTGSPLTISSRAAEDGLDLVIIGLDTTDPRDGSVADVMSTEVRTIAPEDDLDDAARIMSDAEIRRLPVVEKGGRLVGVLSHGNLVQATAGTGPGREATTGVTRGA